MDDRASIERCTRSVTAALVNVFYQCRQLRVVGARAGSRPILCERTLVASVGKYRRVVLEDAADEAVNGLRPMVVVPLLMLAVRVTDWPTVAYGSGQLDTLTLPMATSSPDDILAAGGASFSMPAAHTPFVCYPERTRCGGVMCRQRPASRTTHRYRFSPRGRCYCRTQRRRWY